MSNSTGEKGFFCKNSGVLSKVFTLVFVGIPVYLICVLAFRLIPIISGNKSFIYLIQDSKHYKPIWRTYLIYEALIYGVIIFLSLALLYLTYQRRKKLKAASIVYFSICLLVSTVNFTLVGYVLGADIKLIPWYLFPMVVSITLFIVFVPLLLKSKKLMLDFNL